LGVTLARLFSFMDEQAAIQNLDFLRQLIAEARASVPYDDMERLRMIYGMGVGTDSVEEA
jgi:hypothetical protein